MSAELSDNYLRTTARQVGVLPFWLDDCVQEMRIALWKAKPGAPLWAVARYTAIDFQRKNSHMNRRAKTSPGVHTFTEYAADPNNDAELLFRNTTREPPSDDLVDLEAACEGMKPRTRQILGLLSMGLLQREIADRLRISESRVAQIVKGARKELAACLT